ncbi:uncharacterized protein LOC124485554 [Hypomesus transpacificus]|uniref:uncharacterized protein LOC124485554 n=1 Tax=Hypomesus transpacificus TaxID=137520 RepID=UPI001F0865C1|nr:uncharacterized protein LOC124485554 [Hypomesus transpacificus]
METASSPDPAMSQWRRDAVVPRLCHVSVEERQRRPQILPCLSGGETRSSPDSVMSQWRRDAVVPRPCHVSVEERRGRPQTLPCLSGGETASSPDSAMSQWRRDSVVPRSCHVSVEERRSRPQTLSCLSGGETRSSPDPVMSQWRRDAVVPRLCHVSVEERQRRPRTLPCLSGGETASSPDSAMSQWRRDSVVPRLCHVSVEERHEDWDVPPGFFQRFTSLSSLLACLTSPPLSSQQALCRLSSQQASAGSAPSSDTTYLPEERFSCACSSPPQHTDPSPERCCWDGSGEPSWCLLLLDHRSEIGRLSVFFSLSTLCLLWMGTETRY